MKTNLSILFILITHLSIGQNGPRLSRYVESFSSNAGDSYRTTLISDYEYDVSGNLTEIIKNELGQDGEVISVSGDFYEYTFDGKLSKEISKIYYKANDLWITLESQEYVYDLNGCLIEEYYIRSFEDTLITIKYEREPNCQLKQKKRWDGSLNLVEMVDVVYPGGSIAYRELHYYKNSMGNWEIWNQKDFILYPDNRIDKILTWDKNYEELFFMKEYTYDLYDNLYSWIKHYKYEPNDSTIGWIGFEYYYEKKEYDDDGQVIEKNVDYWNHETDIFERTKMYTYEYDCEKEDLSTLRIKDYNDMFYLEYYRYESFYEEDGKCNNSKEEEISLQVFPNPTTGEITIYSDVFYMKETEEIQMRILDISGKVLLEEQNKEDIGFLKIDLERFSNGVYIIQILSNETLVQEKIVVAK